VSGFNERVAIDDTNFNHDVLAVPYDEIHMIEVSCPYDQMTELDKTRMTIFEKMCRTKIAKYEPLRRHCEETFHQKCKLTRVIVSSLGAVYSESVRKLKAHLGLGDHALKALVRRISTSSLIGSYFL
jgi:hypothetical protein